VIRELLVKWLRMLEQEKATHADATPAVEGLCCSSSDGQGASHRGSHDSTDSELSCAVRQVPADLGDVMEHTADVGPPGVQRSLGLSPDIVNTAVFTKEVVTLELGVLV
jgi:hypothetical protein